MQKSKTAVKPQYGYGWAWREGVGEPELVVRVAGEFGEWLRVTDGTPTSVPVVITIR